MNYSKYLVSETTKEERIALIKSWIPEDEVMDGCDIDLWDMYADYINGTKEIAECNAAFKADYYINYSIREIRHDEIKILDTFLYEAIFIPEGVATPSKDIINQPELQVYVKDFGKNKGDMCLVAQVEDEVVGAVWVRIMNDYGHIDNETPSFAISLFKEYRNYGIGTELMKKMLAKLQTEGYKQASLAVQKQNYAVRMYKKVGFEVVDENEEEFIMVCKL